MSSEVIKCVTVILVAAVLVVTLRTRLQEYGFLLMLVAVAIVLMIAFSSVFDSIEKIGDLLNRNGSANVYFTTALKALGISYTSSFAADTCRDFGMSALAQTAEICGKAAIFVLSIPLVTSVLEMALKFIGL